MKLPILSFDDRFLLICLLGLILLLLAILFLLVLKLLGLIRFCSPRSSSSNDTLRALDTAHIEALKIIKASHVKASHIINDVSGLEKITKRELLGQIDGVFERHFHEMTRISTSLLNTYKDMLDEERRRNLIEVKKFSGEATRVAHKEFSSFADSIKKETLANETLYSRKLAESIKVAESEIADYKKKKVQEIDKMALEVIKKVSTEVIHARVNMEEIGEDILKKVNDYFMGITK